jgi:hypothetical protein
MNETLIKEAVWCHKMSTNQKYEENPHNATRHETCLHELMNRMTEEERKEFNKIIEKNDN